VSRDSRLRIVVTGLIAQHPRLGGVAWDYLQYPLGLARLGHDVYYLEDSGEWPYTESGGPAREDWIARDPSPNVRHLGRVLERFGLGERWMYRFPISPRWYGLSHRRRREVLASADLLLNVSGTLRRPEEYRRIPRLAYIDSDPVFTQVKLTLPRGQLKFQRRVAAHDVHFSFGERLDGRVPATGYRWLPTRQPIVLSEWRTGAEHRDAFTTVMSWTSYRPLRFRGASYAQKDAEFERFADLPVRFRGAPLEVALGRTSHARWQTGGLRGEPRDVLRRLGWRVVDAGRSCGGVEAYRRYVQRSRGEWSIAKGGYVAGQPGWFSCRSACYLAAGRPVVVQETGFGSVLPTGEGLLSFSTPDEARAALEEVVARYRRHARVARELAEAYFDSDQVLGRLVERAAAAPAARVAA
jgi:hypothetical protein